MERDQLKAFPNLYLLRILLGPTFIKNKLILLPLTEYVMFDGETVDKFWNLTLLVFEGHNIDEDCVGVASVVLAVLVISDRVFFSVSVLEVFFLCGVAVVSRWIDVVVSDIFTPPFGLIVSRTSSEFLILVGMSTVLDDFGA